MNMVSGLQVQVNCLNICIGTVIADIALSRAEIEGARLLVYSAALQVHSDDIIKTL